MATWPTVVKTDYAADTPSTQTNVRALRDRDLFLCEVPFSMPFAAAASGGATSWATIVDFSALSPTINLWVPAWAFEVADQFYVAAHLLSYVDAGSGEWRIGDDVTTNYGNAVTVTNTVAAWNGPSRVLLSDTNASARGLWSTCRIQGQSAGGDNVALSTQAYLSWRIEPA
jgi:hypothetical protein